MATYAKRCVASVLISVALALGACWGISHLKNRHPRISHLKNRHPRISHLKNRHPRISHLKNRHPRISHLKNRHPRISHLKNRHPRISHLKNRHPRISHLKNRHPRISHLKIRHPSPQISHLKIRHPRISHLKIRHPRISHLKIRHPRISHLKIRHPRISHLKIRHPAKLWGDGSSVSNRFDVLGALGDPVELWDTFKRETLQAAKECIGERPRSRRGFVSTETLEKIEESRAAGLAGNRDQHRALSRQTRTLLGRDKERYVGSLAEDVEGHLNANDLRPAYRAPKKLRSKSPSRRVLFEQQMGASCRTWMGRWLEDIKSLWMMVVERYGDTLARVNYVQTFQALRLRYEQHQDRLRDRDRGSTLE
ncbi:Protein LIAT1 [Chionoecetes opilio]|uniref:Protein LIAT1 n=1 Tax=Chionoecetes opilio TaxID=41210 RepID=A0A8J4YQL6_CHIOP|nr:Protein LIAT1 [Chionoecetes opilio]